MLFVPQGIREKLRPQRRAADADMQKILKCPSASDSLRRMDALDEVMDCGERITDLAGDLGRWCEARLPEPIMPDHAILVGVGDRPCFERLHVL